MSVEPFRSRQWDDKCHRRPVYTPRRESLSQMSPPQAHDRDDDFWRQLSQTDSHICLIIRLPAVYAIIGVTIVAAAAAAEQWNSSRLGHRIVVVGSAINVDKCYRHLLYRRRLTESRFLLRDAMLSAVYAVVCVCVCLSHSGIVSKRLNVRSRK